MTKKANTKTGKLKVLYQNLNGTWYAFATLGDNVFFGKVPLQLSPSDRESYEKDIVQKLKGRKSGSKAA